MPLLSVRCNHCGAPLQVGESVRFVTCQFCNSQLQVTQTESSAYTEVIKQIADQNTQMMNNLRVIELQNELERLDREWASKREYYSAENEHGQRTPPSMVGGIISLVIGVPFCIFWISQANKMGAPTFFSFFGVIVLVLCVFQAFKSFNNASKMSEDESVYESARTRLLRQLDEVRQKKTEEV